MKYSPRFFFGKLIRILSPSQKHPQIHDTSNTLPEIIVNVAKTFKELEDRDDARRCPNSPIYLQRLKLQQQQADLQRQLKDLQAICPHPLAYIRDDLSLNRERHCPECGQNFTPITKPQTR